jgi:hypothetical protein
MTDVRNYNQKVTVVEQTGSPSIQSLNQKVTVVKAAGSPSIQLLNQRITVVRSLDTVNASANNALLMLN